MNRKEKTITTAGKKIPTSTYVPYLTNVSQLLLKHLLAQPRLLDYEFLVL